MKILKDVCPHRPRYRTKMALLPLLQWNEQVGKFEQDNKSEQDPKIAQVLKLHSCQNCTGAKTEQDAKIAQVP